MEIMLVCTKLDEFIPDHSVTLKVEHKTCLKVSVIPYHKIERLGISLKFTTWRFYRAVGTS
jgi:hypothetical protein